MIKKIHNYLNRKWKKRARIRINGSRNVIPRATPKQVKISICGNDNKIIIPKPERLAKLEIKIFGNFNTVIIEEGVHGTFEIQAGFKASRSTSHCSLFIGKNTGSNGSQIVLFEKGSEVTIGEGCMLASDTAIWASDTHAILDQSGHLTNHGISIHIGNRVWVGAGSKIGKNTAISDNSIVGWGSVVTKKFNEAGVVIAGNPARIVKRHIKWSKSSPDSFLQD